MPCVIKRVLCLDVHVHTCTHADCFQSLQVPASCRLGATIAMNMNGRADCSVSIFKWSSKVHAIVFVWVVRCDWRHWHGYPQTQFSWLLDTLSVNLNSDAVYTTAFQNKQWLSKGILWGYFSLVLDYRVHKEPATDPCTGPNESNPQSSALFILISVLILSSHVRLI
jgi:hypothetical protein